MFFLKYIFLFSSYTSVTLSSPYSQKLFIFLVSLNLKLIMFSRVLCSTLFYFLNKPLTPLTDLKYDSFMIIHVFMPLNFLNNVPGMTFFLFIQHITLQLNSHSYNATPNSFKNFLCNSNYISIYLEYYLH